MTRRFLAHATLLVVSTSALTVVGLQLYAAEAPSRMTTTAPVKGYAVSFFSEEGYPWIRVQGTSADISDPKQVRLEEMTLTRFRGDASKNVDTVFIAPLAILEPDTRTAHGDQSVRVIGPDFELSGDAWSYRYDEAAQTVHLRQKARIIFHRDLPSILQ